MEECQVDGERRATEGIAYRPMRPGEAAEICALIAEVFIEFVGCNYPPEGVQEFLRYAQRVSLLERSRTNHFTLVAMRDERIVGMIEMRECSHVCLFFVDRRLHGHGIGRGLFERALGMCKKKKPELDSIDVNSSPNAVGAYQRLGFRQVEPEKTLNGITFVPMILRLK